MPYMYYVRSRSRSKNEVYQSSTCNFFLCSRYCFRISIQRRLQPWEQIGTMKLFKSFPQHAPQPEHRLTEKIELFYSPVIVFLAVAFFLLAAGWVGFWTIVAIFDSRFSLTFIVGSIAAFFGIPILLSFLPAVLHPFMHKGCVVTLDIDGVTDARKKNSFVPWSKVAHIRLGVGETASILCFDFRSPDRGLQDLPRLGTLGVLANKLSGTGDWNTSLRLLACSKQDVLKSARRLRQESIRRQIVKLNAGRNLGWSGSL